MPGDKGAVFVGRGCESPSMSITAVDEAPEGGGRFTWTSPNGISTTVEPHDYRLGP